MPRKRDRSRSARMETNKGTGRRWTSMDGEKADATGTICKTVLEIVEGQPYIYGGRPEAPPEGPLGIMRAAGIEQLNGEQIRNARARDHKRGRGVYIPKRGGGYGAL